MRELWMFGHQHRNDFPTVSDSDKCHQQLHTLSLFRDNASPLLFIRPQMYNLIILHCDLISDV